MSSTLRAIVSQLDATETGLDRVNENVGRTRGSFGMFQMVGGNLITDMVRGFGSLASEIPKIGDELTSLNARLNMVGASNDKVFESAMRARGSYVDMGNAVGKLGMLAGSAFEDQDEIIQFTELLQKSLKIGGSGMQEQTSAMYQLTQAMAAGKLQGDEFRSIMENAPLLADAIAKEMEIPKGQLKELSSQGIITADVIKNALFGSAESINAMFGNMPVTFSESMVLAKNVLTKNLEDMAIGISQTLGKAIGKVTSLISENLDLIKNGIIIVSAVVVALATVWAVSWAVMNWPIVAIGIGIALLVSTLTNMGISTEQILGFVGGLFSGLFSTIYNGVALVYNMFATIAEFLINVWTEPEYTFKKFVNNMIDSVFGFVIGAVKGFDQAATSLANTFIKGANFAIGGINHIIEALNKIPGVNIGIVQELDPISSITTELEELRDKMKLDLPPVPEDYIEVKRLEYQDIGSNAMAGQEWGSQLLTGLKGVSDAMSGQDGLAGINDKLSGKGSLKSVGDVEIKDENLKYLFDLANVKQQIGYQQAPVNVHITTGDINNGADANRLLRQFENIVVSAFDNSLAMPGV